MTENVPSFSEAIRDFVLGYFAEHSGMPMTFVCAVDWIDGADGANTVTVSHFEGQPTHRSMGLVRYLDFWFEDDAKTEVYQAIAGAMGDDDEDE